MKINILQKSASSAKELFRSADFDNILKCVHCGLCLDNCPTYRELNDEKDSPRGRLYLMRGLWEGELELVPEVIDPLKRCLNCRSCETACPSAVPYGELIEKTRGIILENTKQSLKEKILRFFLLRGLFRSTNLLIAASWFLKMYVSSGLPKLITNSSFSKLLPKSIVFQHYLLPKFTGESFKQRYEDKILSSLLKKKKHQGLSQPQKCNLKVALFTGCIMDVSEPNIHESSLSLLRRVGCEVVIPVDQNCCGAIHVHSGDRESAREFAIKNIEIFEQHNFDAIITNAAGCGAQLKEYHNIFDGSCDKSIKDKWSDETSKKFENKVIDIMEFLSNFSELLVDLSCKSDDDIILYDAPCHLMHAQKVDVNPRKLLSSLPGVKLIELKESSWCCGSAGIYNLIQPKLSDLILARKIESIRDSLVENPRATTILTANPGCFYQIQAGMRRIDIDLRVMHPVEFLAERLSINQS